MYIIIIWKILYYFDPSIHVLKYSAGHLVPQLFIGLVDPLVVQKWKCNTKKTNSGFEAKTFLYKITISFCWYVMLPWRNKVSKLHEFTMLTPKLSCYTRFFYIKNERIGRIEIFKFWDADLYPVMIIRRIKKLQKTRDKTNFIAFLIGKFFLKTVTVAQKVVGTKCLALY